MTNLEAIRAKIGTNYPIDDSTFNAALIESGIDGSDLFTGGKNFDWAMVNILVSLLSSAETIKEGGYSVSLNLGALQRMLNFLLRRWGWRDPSQPIIRDRSKLW